MRSRSLPSLFVLGSVLALGIVSGCPGGPRGGVTVVGPKPELLGYAIHPAKYRPGDPIAPNLPFVQGSFETFSIEPALPAGLGINSETGEITGTPLEPALATTHVVTARRGRVSSSTEISIEVLTPAIALAADRPLVSSVLEAGAGAPVSGTSLASAGTGITPSSPLATVSGAAPASREFPPLTSPEAVPVMLSAVPWYDVTVPVAPRITVTPVDLPVSQPLEAELLAPYGAVAPTLPSFSLESLGAPVELLEGELRLRLRQTAGAGLTFESQRLATHALLVRRLSTGQNLTSTSSWFPHRGKLYYRSVNSAAKDKLFVHDAEAGTFRQLLDMAGSGVNDATRVLGEYNGRLFLRVRNNPTQKRVKLFRYDAEADAIQCVSNTFAAGEDNPDSVAVYAGSLYFAAQVSSSARKLFRYTENTAGDVATLERVVHVSGATSNDDPAGLTVHGGSLYFAARTSTGARKLFRYDASSPLEVVPISDTAEGASANDEPANLTPLGADLYFTSRSAAGARKLWRYEPGAHRTVRVADVCGDASQDDAPSSLVAAGGRLYFVASPAPGLTKAYRFEPSSGTCRRLGDTAGAGADDAPSTAVPLGGSVYFSARNALGARKLWRFDESAQTLTQVSNTRLSAAGSDDPAGATAFAGKLYFTALRAEGVRKLYRLDPEDGSVCQVADTRGNPAADDRTEIAAVFGGHLHFSAIPSGGGSPQLFRLCDRSTLCASH